MIFAMRKLVLLFLIFSYAEFQEQPGRS